MDHIYESFDDPYHNYNNRYNSLNLEDITAKVMCINSNILLYHTLYVKFIEI